MTGLVGYRLRAVLWHFGAPGGEHPGSFGEAILEACSSADDANRARLEAAFPEWAIPHELAAHFPSGIDAILAILADQERVGAPIEYSRSGMVAIAQRIHEGRDPWDGPLLVLRP